MVQRARDKQVKKGMSIHLFGIGETNYRFSVLDIGCYTGLSALAWYEGTRETKAEV